MSFKGISLHLMRALPATLLPLALAIACSDDDADIPTITLDSRSGIEKIRDSTIASLEATSFGLDVAAEPNYPEGPIGWEIEVAQSGEYLVQTKLEENLVAQTIVTPQRVFFRECTDDTCNDWREVPNTLAALPIVAPDLAIHPNFFLSAVKLATDLELSTVESEERISGVYSPLKAAEAVDPELVAEFEPMLDESQRLEVSLILTDNHELRSLEFVLPLASGSTLVKVTPTHYQSFDIPG